MVASSEMLSLYVSVEQHMKDDVNKAGFHVTPGFDL